MSAVLYGALTRKRYAADPGTSTTKEPPALGSYVDAMSALVPAEVIAAHAAILAIATDSSENAGKETVAITAPGALQLAFWVLLAFSIGLYWLGRQGAVRRGDFFRMLVPPAAFVAWMLLQKPTAIDALFSNLDDALRYTIAVLVALALSAIAAWLAKTADQAPKTT